MQYKEFLASAENYLTAAGWVKIRVDDFTFYYRLEPNPKDRMPLIHAVNAQLKADRYKEVHGCYKWEEDAP